MLEECDIASSTHTSTTLITLFFLNHLSFCYCQHGCIPPVTIGNQQHPSILSQAFIYSVHCHIWSSRGQQSHTDALKSLLCCSFLFLQLLSLASSSPSLLCASWLFHLSFLRLLPPPSLLCFLALPTIFSLSVSLSLLFTLVLDVIKLYRDVKHHEAAECRLECRANVQLVWDAEL